MASPKPRNNSLVSINAVPAEILEHIFHLAADTERCVSYHERDDDINPPTFLDYLPRVCSYWRQISINSCTLWSHIDLVEWGLHRDYLYSRARLWVKRAGDSLLDIHIYGHSNYQPEAIQYLSDFLAPLMNQVFSLEVEGDRLPVSLLHSIFACWFINGTPGALRRFTLSDCRNSPLYFRRLILISIVPNDQSQVTLARVEEFFRPITVLSLFGVFLPFHSHAYCDLVELRLVGFSSEHTVTRTQLTAALSSSPRLRTIIFGIRIADPLHNSAQLLPVPLENLEELGVVESPLCHYGSVLGILAPASKPLRMFINLHTDTLRDQLGAETERFFRCSKVVALYINGRSTRHLFPSTLESLPHLHTVLLQFHIYSNEYYLPEGGANAAAILPACPQLRNLFLSSCTFEIQPSQAFQNVIVAHSVQTLGLLYCLTVDPNGQYISLAEPDLFIADVHPGITYRNSGEDFEKIQQLWGF